MSEASDNAAIAVARQFIVMFNDQNHDALAATLNYPHVRLANDRFDTLWIATLDDGHWGIQFRSSFLRT